MGHWCGFINIAPCTTLDIICIYQLPRWFALKLWSFKPNKLIRLKRRFLYIVLKHECYVCFFFNQTCSDPLHRCRHLLPTTARRGLLFKRHSRKAYEEDKLDQVRWKHCSIGLLFNNILHEVCCWFLQVSNSSRPQLIRFHWNVFYHSYSIESSGEKKLYLTFHFLFTYFWHKTHLKSTCNLPTVLTFSRIWHDITSCLEFTRYHDGSVFFLGNPDKKARFQNKKHIFGWGTCLRQCFTHAAKHQTIVYSWCFFLHFSKTLMNVCKILFFVNLRQRVKSPSVLQILW